MFAYISYYNTYIYTGRPFFHLSIFCSHRQNVASAVVCHMSCSLCRLSAGCRANIRAASLAGRPNQTLEAGLIGLTYSIKPSIKPPLTLHWGLTTSDITE